MKKLNIDLNKYTDEELCEIWNRLNTYTWPELLGEKPLMWDKLPNDHNSSLMEFLFPSKSKFISSAYESIRIKVGMTLLLEWHWLHNLNRTKEQYYSWLNRQIGDRYLSF